MSEHRFRHAAPFAEHDRARARLGRGWIVSDAMDGVPESWRVEALCGGRILAAHPWARIAVRRSNDVVLARIGVAVDPLSPEDELIERVTLDGTADSARRSWVDALLEFGGMYAAILSTPAGTWISSDPAGMAQVFHRAGRAASSVALLEPRKRSEEIDLAYPLEGSDDWYTGSVVPWVGVRVLLANHLLDVGSGETDRFWPQRDFPILHADDALEIMTRCLRGMVAGGARRGPLLASITGGRDSRVCLGALREMRDDVEFFTLRNSGIKRCDLEIPERLRSRHGLPHGFVEAPPPESWLLDLYDEAASWMVVGGPRAVADGCRRLAGPDYIHVNGNLAAITKAYFWSHPWPKRVYRRALAKDFVNKAPCIWAGIDEWVATLPELDARTIYNLMYFEQKGGRYSGLRDTASGIFFDSLPPFNHRRIFAALCGMPRRNQYGGLVLRDLVGSLWPELLETPYCPVTRTWGAYVPKRWKAVARRWATTFRAATASDS